MLAFWGLPGGMEWAVIAFVAILVFGKRLPSIARSVGSSVIEFKKGLAGVKSEVKELESGLQSVSKSVRKDLTKE